MHPAAGLACSRGRDTPRGGLGLFHWKPCPRGLQRCQARGSINVCEVNVQLALRAVAAKNQAFWLR